MYPNYYRAPQIYDERFGGFIVPFLLGGLGGAAITGLARPRPVYVNPYQPYQPSPYYPNYYPYNNY